MHQRTAIALAVRPRPVIQARVGIHAGPAVAGVIGTTKFVYDLWGDAVNTASRLETTAPAGTIQVSAAVADTLARDFDLAPRGPIDLKGKGLTEAYLLIGRRPSASGSLVSRP